MKAIDLFCRMQVKWNDSIPEALAGENPLLLAELLRLAHTPRGSHSAVLQLKLGILQSRTSKLVGALVREGWLEEVPDNEDTRRKYIRTTALARSFLSSFDTCFREFVRDPPVPVRLRNRPMGPDGKPATLFRT